MKTKQEVTKELLIQLNTIHLPNVELEVSCESGTVSIVTKQTLIEIVEIREYKQGLVNLIACSKHFSKPKCILVLFNKNPKERINLNDTIFRACRANNVYSWTYYPDKDLIAFLAKYDLENVKDTFKTREQKAINRRMVKRYGRKHPLTRKIFI